MKSLLQDWPVAPATEGEGPKPPAEVISQWRKTLALDFDGVLHRYGQGWQDGSCYDIPVEGAKAAAWKMVDEGYNVVVFTSRKNLDAVKEWLARNDFPPLHVTNEKPPALVYVDDRAVRFTNWADILKLYC